MNEGQLAATTDFSRPLGGNLISRIVADDLCISCGACIQACSAGNLSMGLDEWRGAYGPQVGASSPCSQCSAACVSVCPSVGIDFPQLLAADGGNDVIDRYGNVLQVLIGHSRAFQQDGRSSSGGIVKAVLQHLLEKEGGAVIALGEPAPGRYEPIKLSRPDEVAGLPGSIYHNISFEQALVLLKSLKTPVVLVGLPCQLAGIKKFINHAAPDLLSSIRLNLGLICGWMYSFHAVEAFACYQKLTGNLQGVAYRGENKVGDLKLFTDSGVHCFSRRPPANELRQYFSYYAAFSRYSRLLRCRLCEDHLNVLADISIGDAWLKRVGSRKESLIIIRSSRGNAVMEDLAAQGAVSLEPGSLDDIEESQSKDLVLSLTAQRLNRYLRKRGVNTPTFLYSTRYSTRASVVEKNGSSSFFQEMWMRRLIRRKRYELFRSAYMLFHGMRYVRTLVHRAFKR